MLSATLIGSNRAEMPALALSVTVGERGSPVLDLCRELVRLGHGDESLTVYRDTVPALVIPSVHRAAKLSVHERNCGGPAFVPHRPWSGCKPLGH